MQINTVHLQAHDQQNIYIICVLCPSSCNLKTDVGEATITWCCCVVLLNTKYIILVFFGCKFYELILTQLEVNELISFHCNLVCVHFVLFRRAYNNSNDGHVCAFVYVSEDISTSEKRPQENKNWRKM